jgi:hypothetical protein
MVTWLRIEPYWLYTCAYVVSSKPAEPLGLWHGTHAVCRIGAISVLKLGTPASGQAGAETQEPLSVGSFEGLLPHAIAAASVSAAGP